jgi:hypothetical protein
MCYDTRRDRVYIGKGSEFSAYDIQANAWTSLASSAVGSGVQSCMNYDAENDVVLVNIYNASSGGDAVKVYNPAANQWTSGLRAMPSTTAYRPCYNAFYDPVLNVHFFFGAGDSNDDGVMLAYRYKGGTPSVVRGREKACMTSPVISVSPNPARKNVTLHLEGAAGVPERMGIYDLRGRLLVDLTQTANRIDGPAMAWDASGLSNGIYLVKASWNERVMTARLLIQK